MHPVDGVDSAGGAGFNSFYFSRLQDTLASESASQGPVTIKWGKTGSFGV